MLTVHSPFFTRATSFQSCRCKFRSMWVPASSWEEGSGAVWSGHRLRSTLPGALPHCAPLLIFAIIGMSRKKWEQGFPLDKAKEPKQILCWTFTCLCVVSRMVRAMEVKCTLQTLSTTQDRNCKSTRDDTKIMKFSYYELSQDFNPNFCSSPYCWKTDTKVLSPTQMVLFHTMDI